MKKFLIIALTLAMLCSLFTVNAFAAPIGAGDSVNADVEIQLGGTINHKYSVDIEFTGMTFVYGNGATWNPVTKVYDYATDASWTEGSITVTNSSDMPIKYTATKTTEATTYGEVTLNMANATNTIVKCEINGTPASATINVTLSGKPSLLSPSSGTVKLSNITVLIEAVS